MKRKFTMFTLALLMLGLMNAHSQTLTVNDNEFTFEWTDEYGTFASAVQINGEYYATDGGFFLLKIYDEFDNLLIFGDVFEELSVGNLHYHASGTSKRLYADFTGAQYDGIWGTKALCDNPDFGNTLRGTDLNGALFYGVMIDNTLGPVGYYFPANTNDPFGEISLSFGYKFLPSELNYYKVVVEFHHPFRPEEAKDAGFYTYNEFEGLVALADTELEVNLNVYNSTQELYYATIQEAIDEANANDMIVVAAGTYEGTILIDKAITLTGDVDNPQNVVINAPENVAKSYDNDVIQVVTDNVTIQGFTLQGAKDQAGGGQGRTNSGITLGGDYLILGSKPAGATDFTFSSWWGIGVKDIVIKNNIITDNSYGIFVFHSQNVTIEDNVIHGNTYEGATSETWSGKGIAIYTSQDMADNTLAVDNTALPATNNITIHNNEIYNNELFGIELNHSESWNGGDAGPFDVDVKITDNKIYNNGRTDNYLWGDLDYYRGITANGNEENVTVTGNEIYGHTATSGANFTAANAGIRARNTKDWTIQDNEIHGNLRGIYAYGDDTEEIEIVFNLIYDNAQGVTVSSSTTGSVNNNAIYNNDDDTWQTDGIDPFGVVNLDVAKASDLDAECNWWGTTVDTEIEAMINGDVDYRPWLKSDDLENPSCSGGLIFINGTPYTAGDAQDAIDDAVEGDVVTFLYDPGSLIIDNKEITVKYDFVKSFN
jgi:parallel beta-helix repeat protein